MSCEAILAGIKGAAKAATLSLAALLSMAPREPPTGAANLPYAGERRAAYGPIRLCIGDYALRVAKGEAAAGYVRADGGIGLVTLYQQPWRGLTIRSGATNLEGYKYRRDEVRTAGGITINRFRIEKWSGYRAGIPGEMVWDSKTAHRVYTVSPIARGNTLTVSADVFEGRHDDIALLNRIEPRGGGRCDALDRPTSPGTLPVAELYQPEPVKGPARICSGGLALDVRADETLTWGWGTNGAPRNWLLKGSAGTFVIGLFIEGYSGPRPRSLAKIGVRVERSAPGNAAIIWPKTGPQTRSASRYMGSIVHSHVPEEAITSLLERITIPDRRYASCN